MPAGGHSTLSEPESGRWHPAVLDVVEAVDELAYSNSVLFHQSLSRTKGTGRHHQLLSRSMKLMARFQRERDLLYSGDHIDDG